MSAANEYTTQSYQNYTTQPFQDITRKPYQQEHRDIQIKNNTPPTYKPNEFNVVPNIEQYDVYQQYAINSLNQAPDYLLLYFFSKDNVEFLQNQMIQQVYNIKKMKINAQNTDELLAIMRNKYINGMYGMVNCQDDTIINKIKLLNRAVLQECIKQILSGIEMYEQYYKDASTLPVPLSRPVLATQKGSREMQTNIGFESAHEVNRAMASFNMRYNII